MRPVYLAQGVSLEDLFLAIREIELASQEMDLGEIMDQFRIAPPVAGVKSFVETYTLDASTATVTDVANVLATFIDLVQRRNKRTGG